MKNIKKNAFTLIELLAVIVILAIIALIATPIILGIVEDARRDSFMRSVELVISATDIDIFNKNFNNMYTYTINDGVVSNLEVGVKNTDGMNGSITYDTKGNDTYAIHNGKYCVIKTSTMNKAEITDYVEGECELPRNFLQFIYTSTENDIQISGNGQLINLGKYGIRYQGIDPDNYIYFNCEDYSNQSSNTCDVWRIIGEVDGKVKIISSNIESINLGLDTNDWSSSLLKASLNGEIENSYYETLTEATRNLGFISPSTWYLRGYIDYQNGDILTKTMLYDIERTTGEVFYETPQIDNMKIGLMYPSDWAFASMETTTCTSSNDVSNYDPCAASNWIIEDFAMSNYMEEWLITPGRSYYSSSPSQFTGRIGFEYVEYGIHIPTGIGMEVVGAPILSTRPVLYLSNDIQIQGEGTLQNPYKLSK